MAQVSLKRVFASVVNHPTVSREGVEEFMALARGKKNYKKMKQFMRSSDAATKFLLALSNTGEKEKGFVGRLLQKDGFVQQLFDNVEGGRRRKPTQDRIIDVILRQSVEIQGIVLKKSDASFYILNRLKGREMLLDILEKQTPEMNNAILEKQGVHGALLHKCIGFEMDPNTDDASSNAHYRLRKINDGIERWKAEKAPSRPVAVLAL